MFNKLKRKEKEIRNVRDIQSKSLSDDYMVGLYNGLELALAIINDKDPEFETCQHKTEVNEIEPEKQGRTVYSGKIPKQ